MSCGVFGIYGHKNAAELTYLGLYSLQHRGQESAGIITSDGQNIRQHKGLGLVSEVFSDVAKIKRLTGHLAVGHNRYSTTGSPLSVNVQPLLVNSKDGPLSISHNGDLVNAGSLRGKMQQEGSIFQTSIDSEIILHLMAKSREQTIQEKLTEALSQVRGAYSLLIACKNKLIGARDPYGFRPLCLGKLDEAWIITSESCALDIIGAKYIRDVEPGELVVINEDGLNSYKPFKQPNHSFCIFEYIYLSRPDSKIFGDNVDKTRRRLGRQLAIEQPAWADIVISVPDSSNTAALGYSETARLRFELGLIRNHYIGRSFIEPVQSVRELMVRIKFNPVVGVLKGKRVVVVEDSIVRGTTLKHLTKLIRGAGASEIHVRVSSPPLKYPCFYGVDFPTQRELITSSHSVEGIRRHLEVESLGYLSMEGMLHAAPGNPEDYCTACFNQNYPVPPEKTEKLSLEPSYFKEQTYL